MVLCAVAVGIVHAQSLQAPPPARAAAERAEELSSLARGWALLSQASLPAAEREAGQLLRRHPRSVAALALGVEVALVQKDPQAALELYGSWLNGRTLEEPGVLRRIARQVLRDGARRAGSSVTARRSLAQDGDDTALRELRDASRRGSPTETRLLASMGDVDAVRRLGVMLQQGRVDPVSALEALGDSGDTTAGPRVAEQLSDGRPEVRGAAAEALGKLGRNDGEARTWLMPLLSDRSPHVRTKAAGALYRLGDPAGAPVLRELAAADTPIGRLVAAEAMASHPDASWVALVGDLARHGVEPEVRLGAARLLAPHDPALAQSVAREFEPHGNLAVRELSWQVSCDAATGDSLGVLRQLLQHGDERTRLRAADRILALTR